MYKITVEGHTVATSDFAKYSAISGTLSQEINAASILEFTLPPTNPQLDAFALRRRPVQLLSDNTVLFEGDVVERTMGIDGSVTVKCQDALGWLNDVVIPKPSFSGTVAAYWDWLIAKYNDNTSGWRHVKAGMFRCAIMRGTFILTIQQIWVYNQSRTSATALIC